MVRFSARASGSSCTETAVEGPVARLKKTVTFNRHGALTADHTVCRGSVVLNCGCISARVLATKAGSGGAGSSSSDDSESESDSGADSGSGVGSGGVERSSKDAEDVAAFEGGLRAFFAEARRRGFDRFPLAEVASSAERGLYM